MTNFFIPCYIDSSLNSKTKIPMTNKSINLLAISLSGAVAATALAGSFSASQAATVTYTDYSAFSAAAGTLNLEDFDVPDTGNQNPLSIGGFTFTADSGTNRIENNMYRGLVTPSQSTVISHTGPLFAFGGNWNLPGVPPTNGAGIGIQVSYANGDIGEIPWDYTPGGFWGFTSDVAFTSVTLVGDSGQPGAPGTVENFTLDNLSYEGNPDDPAGTPESSTVIGLLAVGLLGVTSRKLRR